jgi:TRAP-type mannitol/chloroaromatic compound transport system substrate-binding protein
MMDRRSFVKKAGLAAGGAVFGSALAAPAIAQSAPTLKWRLASTWPKSIDTLFGTAELLAKTVSEATDGKFQIQVFAGGEVVPPFEVVDAVGNKTVQMCHTASYYYWGKDPTFAFGTAVPVGLNSRLQNAWMYEAGGIDLMNGFFQKYNVYGLPGGNTGAQMGGWYRKEIKSIDDFKGLKMRIAGFAGAVFAKLGAVPQQVAAVETYQQLEKGQLDATEWVGPYDDEKLGLAKVAKYYYYPGWWEGEAMVHFFINLEEWNALPKSYQAVLSAAAAQSNLRMLTRYDAVNPPALRKLVAAGAELRSFSPEILEACFKAANEVFDEKSAENADFKKVYEAMKAVRNEGYLWNQLTDGTFDNFMMAQQRAGAL